MTGQDDCTCNADKAWQEDQEEKVPVPVRCREETSAEEPAAEDGRHRTFGIPRRWYIY